MQCPVVYCIASVYFPPASEVAGIKSARCVCVCVFVSRMSFGQEYRQGGHSTEGRINAHAYLLLYIYAGHLCISRILNW